ncbi:MAG: AEC family transporter [Eubacteriales bacterium]|nr:AEC family transporter [Eubacteriales bacterium]MDY3332302.1 AEC family transporter [Gallibacter sp.]
MYTQFFVMFALIFTGFIMRRLELIKDEMNKSLNTFIVYWAYPCLLTYNIGTMKMNWTLIMDFMWMLLLGGVMLGVSSLYVRIYTKIRKFPDSVSNVSEMAMVCPNNGFMGFPIALSFLGSQGLFFMVAENSAMNIFFFTYALFVLRRNNENKGPFSLKNTFISTTKLIINPNIFGTIAGLVIAVLGISLNNIFGIYFNYIGAAATPMAMIFIGSTLAKNKFFELFKNRYVIESAINKLLVIPLIAVALMLILPDFIVPEMKAIIVLGFCFPTAATVAMLAEQENQDHELASRILFFNTVLSMATVPVVITLVDKLFL